MVHEPASIAGQNDAQSIAKYVDYSAAVCIPIIVCFAALRTYGKILILKKTWDDLVCMLSLVTTLTYIALGLALVHAGDALGRHFENQSIEEKQRRLSSGYQAIYGPFVWLVKLTIFILYIEIFGSIRWLRLSAFIGALFTGMVYLGSMIVFLVFCSPFVVEWTSQRCHRAAPFLASVGVVNFVSDLFLIVLPLPAVWNLQLPRKKKVAISVIFMTGTVSVSSQPSCWSSRLTGSRALVASALGFYYRYRLYLKNGGDVTYSTIPTIVMA